ncbi:hypothetical protein R84B8_00470 [Treponema sp. R8-4-B8]
MKKFLVILLTALTLFAGCDQDVTNTINSQYDLTALEAKIAEANAAKEGVQVATSAGEVAQGRKWVLQSDLDTFGAAILVAVGIQTFPTSQAKVDKAVGDLSTAIAIFKVHLGTGTKSSNFTQDDLTALITEAEKAQETVTISSNGTDVIPQEYWVTSAIMTALNSAISTAKGSTGTLDSRYTGLNTALNSFYTNKKPGTATSWRSITITGLISLDKFSNGTEIMVGLFNTNNIIGLTPQISGSSVISSSRAIVTLYNNTDDNHTLWTGEGSYYVGFLADGETYVSKSQITFNSTTPNPSAKYSDFGPYVYEYNCGVLATAIGQTIPSTGIELNSFCVFMSGGKNYVQLLASGDLPAPFYKVKELGALQAFTGIETLTAATMIYTTYDLSSLMLAAQQRPEQNE